VRLGRALLLVAMLVVHGGAALSPWLAPYDPAEQHRDSSYAPPTRVHLVDPQGAWQRPFVCAAVADGTPGARTTEDCRQRYPIRWFVRPDGEAHGTVGTSPSRRRLFSVDAPGRLFLLGTDIYGRDQLSRLLVGARMSLLAAVLGTCLAIGLGTLGGMLAGGMGGATDTTLTAASTLLRAIPILYLLLAARAALPLTLGPADVFLAITVLLGLVGWSGPYRLVRAVARSASAADYVSAARGLGASTPRILRRHVWGAVSGVAAAQALALVPQFVVAEVTLSYVGLGVAEPVPSWGTMLAESLRAPVLISHTWMASPIVALVAVSVLYYGMILAFRREIPSND